VEKTDVRQATSVSYRFFSRRKLIWRRDAHIAVMGDLGRNETLYSTLLAEMFSQREEWHSGFLSHKAEE
jgi:hypothetical protein